MSGVSFIAADAYVSTCKTSSACIQMDFLKNLSQMCMMIMRMLCEVDSTVVVPRNLANFMKGAGIIALRVDFGRQMHGNVECPLSGIRSFGRVWMEGAGI